MADGSQVKIDISARNAATDAAREAQAEAPPVAKHAVKPAKPLSARAIAAKEVSLGTSLGVNVAVIGDLNPGDRVVSAGGYPLLTAPVFSLGP